MKETELDDATWTSLGIALDSLDERQAERAQITMRIRTEITRRFPRHNRIPRKRLPRNPRWKDLKRAFHELRAGAFGIWLERTGQACCHGCTSIFRRADADGNLALLPTARSGYDLVSLCGKCLGRRNAESRTLEGERCYPARRSAESPSGLEIRDVYSCSGDMRFMWKSLPPEVPVRNATVPARVTDDQANIAGLPLLNDTLGHLTVGTPRRPPGTPRSANTDGSQPAAASEALQTVAKASAEIPFSAGQRIGDMLFLSGHVGVLQNGQLAEGIVGQTTQAIENIGRALQNYGTSLRQVADVTAFLVNPADYEAFNLAYVTALNKPLPTRTTVFVAGLPQGALVELKVIVRMPPPPGFSGRDLD